MLIFAEEISSNAGPASDGVSVGSIARSSLIHMARLSFIETIYALRRDMDGTDQITDVTSLVAAGPLSPFGTLAQMSVTDELWLAPADGVDICELYPTVGTAGAYVGTGIEILESLDGETLTPVQNLVDTSNGFRAGTGVYRITFSVGDRKVIAPRFGATKRKYIVIRPKNLGTVTTAPVLSSLQAACPVAQQTYINADFVTDADWDNPVFTPELPSFLITPHTDAWFGLPDKSIGLDSRIWRSLQNTSDMNWRYWDGTQEVSFSDLIDPTNGFENGPATYTAGVFTENKIRWSVPATWPKVDKTFNLSDGTTVTHNAVWVHVYPTVNTYAPTRSPQHVIRARVFGAGRTTGIGPLAKALIIAKIFVRIGESQAGCVFSLSSALTGQSVTVTVPANTLQVTVDNPDVTFAVGDSILLLHISGGPLRSVQIYAVEG